MKINFLDDYNYHASYYLYNYKKLLCGFYQTHGFIVNERPIVKTSAEVVFPYSSLLDDREKLDLVAKRSEQLFIKTFFLEADMYDSLNLAHLDINFDKNYDKERVKKLLSKDSIFENYLGFLEMDLDVNINIIPVNFGPSFTYTYDLSEKGVNIYTTYRYDLATNFFISGLIGATVLYKVEENKNYLDESLRGNVPWVNRQFLVDFLSTRTQLTKLVGQTKGSGTLRSLKAAQQYGQLFIESKAYLERLKLAYPVEIHFEKNRLVIDDTSVDLTIAEKNIMSYLYENRNQVCTYEDLGDVIWKDNEEKYSIYAISKHLANIRKKVSEAGFTNNFIQVARKQGVILTI